DDNDDEDDDQSINIEETDDEDKTESDNDDQVMDDAKKENEEKNDEKEQADLEINSLMDIQIQQKIPTVLLAPLLDVLASVVPPTPTTPTPKPLTTPLPTPQITNEAPAALVPKSEAFTDVLQKVSELSKVPSDVNEYLGSSLGDTLQKALQKHNEELKQQFS
ncbi:hypothetical protein Tco_1281192, partial [Tanacetum coccineum]